eukprot:TRINITY_DN10866_c0_g1_i1.p1 TRINITY_DN10866_c0_g1~~TRINITY_DN10866_c0_g1_i1.p1  ORF type:complete len:489 (-),score=85.43 TRINITY_DN10866_c0_g1_i1:114-1580(-)
MTGVISAHNNVEAPSLMQVMRVEAQVDRDVHLKWSIGIANYFMQSSYHCYIIPLLGLTALLAWCARPKGEKQSDRVLQFQVTYFGVWSLCIGADWLQGPYVYALYEAYGFAKHEVAQLFVAGFASSLVFSCVVGSFADRFGRKRACMTYCVVYILSCITKHFNNYWLLMLGRITGGLATSMLFSCFECWMVSESLNRYQMSGKMLSFMFGVKFQLMYFVAILSGIVAQFGADSWTYGPIAPGSIIFSGGDCVPFDMSAAVLVVALVLIACLWEENYGVTGNNSEGSQGILSSIKEALWLMKQNTNIVLLCITLSSFEGSMYAFVFNWTPALEAENVKTPFGIIFSLFMMACMAGASTSTLIASKVSPKNRLLALCIVGVLAFIIASWAAGVPGRLLCCFNAFLAFEFCVGVYFPSIGIMKSEIVQEQVRGTMYNLFRIPLNIIVLSLLLTNLSMFQCFMICASLLSCSVLCVLFITPQLEPFESGKEM